MGQATEARLTSLFANLDSLLDDPNDLALIKQMVLDRVWARSVKSPEPPSLNKLARDVFNVSHERNEALADQCCPDPQWNMLLDLVVAKTESRRVDVTGLCIASGVPATTALRHIERMHQTGLVKRQICAGDKRRNWIEITPRAMDATEGLLRKMYKAGC